MQHTQDEATSTDAVETEYKRIQKKFRWGRDFLHPPRPSLAPNEVGTGSFPGVKRQGPGVEHPLPSSAEVQERVELYFFTPFVPSWRVMR